MDPGGGFRGESAPGGRRAAPGRCLRARRLPGCRSGWRADSRRVFRNPCRDRKSTRLNSSHVKISYAVFCLKKKKKKKKRDSMKNFVCTKYTVLLHVTERTH